MKSLTPWILMGNSLAFCFFFFVWSFCVEIDYPMTNGISVGLSPWAITVTTRIIILLVGDPYKPFRGGTTQNISESSWIRKEWDLVNRRMGSWPFCLHEGLHGGGTELLCTCEKHHEINQLTIFHFILDISFIQLFSEGSHWVVPDDWRFSSRWHFQLEVHAILLVGCAGSLQQLASPSCSCVFFGNLPISDSAIRCVFGHALRLLGCKWWWSHLKIGASGRWDLHWFYLCRSHWPALFAGLLITFRQGDVSTGSCCSPATSWEEGQLILYQ